MRTYAEPRYSVPRTRKDFCVNGHEIAVVGRINKACRQCQRDKAIKYRRKRKAELHEYKLAMGCVECGYRKSAYALDLHHRDPDTKEFTVGHNFSLAKERFCAEVAKCDVICRNCHAELHGEEFDN